MRILLKTALAVALAMLCTVDANASFVVDNLFTYEVNDDGTSVTLIQVHWDYPSDIVIPDSVTNPDDRHTYAVTALASSLFEDRDYLNSIVIGNNVKTIGDDAFYYCTSLTSITFGNSVEVIGNAAFMGCSLLTSIELPESLTTLGEGAFQVCRNLETINFPEKLTTIPAHCFAGDGFKKLTIPNTIITIDDYAFSGCNQLTSIDLSESLTGIEDYVFYGCAQLESIFIPNSVRYIGNWSFKECTNLKRVTIGNSVEEIGWAAFANATQLTNIVSKAFDPPYLISDDVFDGVDCENVLLQVPAGRVRVYQQTKWKIFSYIEERPLKSTDVNNDGKTDIEDLNIVLNVMLNRGSYSAEIRDASDINGDDKADITDLNYIINTMLGL